MIFVRDKGRMCNNIFQYMQMYAWGKEHNRKTLSMRFSYKYRYFSICDTAHHNFLFYLMGKYGAKLGLLPVIDYDDLLESYEEKERRILSSSHCVVEGWNVRYLPLVEKYFPEIQNLFSFKKSILQRVEKKMQENSPISINIGVHIRRGDYERFQEGRFFFSDEEYLKYIKKLLTLLPHDTIHRIYICGNDPKLNTSFYIQELKGKANVFFPQGNEAEDLCLLSKCDYLLGPVSTFSLIATLYGKAQLHWIEKGEKDCKNLTLNDFQTFFPLAYCMNKLFQWK